MKLPDDKNERNKILGLIAVGVIASCYVGYNFGIKVLLQKRDAAKAKIIELDSKLWQANLDIKQIPLYIRQNNEIIDDILDISETKLNILHPSLGNFLLVADEIIERQADKLGLEIKAIKITGFPVKLLDNEDDSEQDPKAPRFVAYTVNVEMASNFSDLIKLIRSIEEQNPYLCITRLGVIGQPDDVTKHTVTFDVQWPIWFDSKHPMKLVAQKLISENRQ